MGRGKGGEAWEIPVRVREFFFFPKTDYSFNLTSFFFQKWELKVLNTLNWDTSAVLPHDLLDHFLVRLPIPAELKQRVTNHARTLINMCCTGN